MPNIGHAYLFAWRFARYIPEPLLRGIANLAADIAWHKQGKGVKRLESNYGKIRPDLSEKEIRHLSKAGMRSYLQYYQQAFTLPAATKSQLNARVRAVGLKNVTEPLKNGTGVIAVLGHYGNWDLAGAWVAANVAPLLTVAEKLEPPKLYEEFLSFRRGLGMEVLGLGDKGVFGKLAEGLAAPNVIALVADRDLTSRGVEVTLCGQQARVAAGPAALALDTGAPIVPVLISFERLRGAARRAAKTPWGIVLEFCTPIYPPSKNETHFVRVEDNLPSYPGAPKRRQRWVETPVSRPEQIKTLTQKWITVVGEFLQKHPEDWHMLQRVFLADLDPIRLPSVPAPTPVILRKAPSAAVAESSPNAAPGFCDFAQNDG